MTIFRFNELLNDLLVQSADAINCQSNIDIPNETKHKLQDVYNQLSSINDEVKNISVERNPIDELKKMSYSELLEFYKAIKKSFRYYEKKGKDGKIIELEDYSNWYNFYNELNDYIFLNKKETKEKSFFEVDNIKFRVFSYNWVDTLLLELLIKNKNL